MPKVAFEFIIDLGEAGECNFIVSGNFSPGDPGRTSGPPERCYPPEPAEFEILSFHAVRARLKPSEVPEWLLERLTANEDLVERIELEAADFFEDLLAPDDRRDYDQDQERDNEQR